MDIKLKFKKSDLIKPIILNLCDNVNLLSQLDKKIKNSIDLSELQWVSPLSVLPVSSLLFDLKNKDYDFSINKSISLNVKSYLRTIKFFEGVHSHSYFKSNKNYIPIVSLLNSPTTVQNRDQVLSSFLDILLRKIGCKRNLLNGLTYALSEIFDNIWEHSQTKHGWFLAQYYDRKNYADICFLDNGISIKGAYEKKKIKVANDIEAIQLALSGKSTKNKERGFGLRTTKNLITRSLLKGEFLILSGQGGYYSGKGNEEFFNLNCDWKGTIVLLRVNKTKRNINYTRYIE